VKRPVEVSATEGAGLPIAAGTALQALRAICAKFDGTGNKPSSNVLVRRRRPLRRAACEAGRPPRHRHLRRAQHGAGEELGADEVLDYRTPEGARLESPSGRRYDGVVQCADGISWSTLEPVLSDRGKVMDLSISFSAVITAAMHKVTFARKSLVPLALSPNKADLEFLVGLLKDDGNMKTLIDSRLAMWSELVRRAWRDVPPARSWSRWKAKLSVVSPY
jgi:chloroplastic oxoene reductase